MIKKKNKKPFATIKIVEEEERESIFSKPLTLGMLLIFSLCVILFAMLISSMSYYRSASDLEISYVLYHVEVMVGAFCLSLIGFVLSRSFEIMVSILSLFIILCLLFLFISTITPEQECKIQTSCTPFVGEVVNLVEGEGCYDVHDYGLNIDTEYNEGVSCVYRDKEGYIVKDHDGIFYCKIEHRLYVV